jgi:hypothetical protein
MTQTLAPVQLVYLTLPPSRASDLVFELSSEVGKRPDYRLVSVLREAFDYTFIFLRRDW